MTASKAIALLKQAESVRRMIGKVTDAAHRQDLLDVLDDPANNKNQQRLNELHDIVVGIVQGDQKPDGTTMFESHEAALEYLKRDVFPKVSENFHLFKTTKLKQDEYIVINRERLHGNDTYQTYANDRDVNDQLVSMGLPTSVLHMPSVGKLPIKLGVLSTWRKQVATQDGKLNTLEYIPGAADIVGHAFNTFKDVSVQPIEGIDVDIFLNHCRDNLCNGNEAYYEYLMSWLAHLVQRPWERPKTGISIIGDEGKGKGIFIDFIARMLGGRRNANTTTSAKDTKSFNTAVGSKLLVVFDEATFSGDHEQSDFMKKLVTEPFVRIEPKGIDAYEVANYARCFITSNNMESAVPATIGARRWLIIECNNDVTQEHMAALATAIGNNGEDKPTAIKHFVNGFKFHLQNLDISNFNPQTLPDQLTGMETKLHNHYKKDSVFAFLVEWMTSHELTLYRHIEEFRDGERNEYDIPIVWTPAIKLADLYPVYEQQCKDSHARPVGRNRVCASFARYGIESVHKTGNVLYLMLPPPKAMLASLLKHSRFDKLVTEEQKRFIDAWKDPDMDALMATLAEKRKAVSIPQSMKGVAKLV